MTKPPSISPLTVEDVPALITFCEKEDPGKRPASFWRNRFHHWWESNPAADSWSFLGVKLVEGGNLVGVICAIPFFLKTAGHTEVACIRSTWWVTPSARAHSIAVLAELDKLLEPYVNVNSTAIQAIIPLLEMEGWQPVRKEMGMTVLPGALEALFGKLRKRPVAPKRLPQLVSECGDNISTEQALQAADRTWQASLGQCEFGPVRNGAYYKWMVFENPTLPFTLFVQEPGNADNLALFALVSEFGDGALRVMDFWPWGEPSTRYKRLMKKIVKVAKQHGYHSIHVPEFTPSIRTGASMWPCMKRRETQRIYVHMPEGRIIAEDGGNWPANSGDIGI